MEQSNISLFGSEHPAGFINDGHNLPSSSFSVTVLRPDEEVYINRMYSIYFNGFNIFHLPTNHTTTLLVILLHKVANHLLPKKEERKGNTEYQCFHELDQGIIETKLKKYVVKRKWLSMCAYHVMLLWNIYLFSNYWNRK